MEPEVSSSQVGQDLFVLSLFNEDYKGTFLDIGCNDPFKMNNTYQLELKGWKGLSIDILDLGSLWDKRKTDFLRTDALLCDYKDLLSKFPTAIDYLTLDIEGEGMRYQALKRVLSSGHEFKVITIEHDFYRGYGISERLPQRKALRKAGYKLIYPDVSDNGLAFEDWWINPKYICC